MTETDEKTFEAAALAVEIQSIRARYDWLTDPIERASDALQEMPFFRWLHALSSPGEFRNAARNLFFHSVTLPKAVGLMMSTIPLSSRQLIPFLAEHAWHESSHHAMLLDWMTQQGLLSDPLDINQWSPTWQTNACINVAYQIALERDCDRWLVTVNSGIERCSNQLFRVLAPRMRALGAGHEYFDIHMEADVYHSVAGLKHLSTASQSADRRRRLVDYALEGVSLWAAMLHSWIGLSVMPRFRPDGTPDGHA